MEIMTPKHYNWEKFTELLEGKKGCNFQEKIKDNPKSITWKCEGGKDKTLAKNILSKYFPDIDIKKTFKFFDDNGGYCDCEILFNINRVD